MKAQIGIIAFVVILLIIGVYFFKTYDSNHDFKTDVISYLENKGYNYKSDIEQVEIVCFSEKCDILAALVNFKDEPNVDYFYTYLLDTDQIIQIDVYSRQSNQVPKHKE